MSDSAHMSKAATGVAPAISAPQRMEMDTIRVFAVSKLGWIKRQQKKLRDQERESPREYLERESHYLWPYLTGRSIRHWS